MITIVLNFRATKAEAAMAASKVEALANLANNNK